MEEKMKEFLVFLAKAVVVGLILVGLLFLGGAILQRNTVACVDANPTTLSVVKDTNTVTSGKLALGEPQVCKFADGYDSLGKVVPAGTKIEGPAFVKPDRNIDWGNPIYIGEEYTTSASDEVVWLLTGDNACVDAQSLFFTYWSQTNPK
jgi:hypothetical protein